MMKKKYFEAIMDYIPGTVYNPAVFIESKCEGFDEIFQKHIEKYNDIGITLIQIQCEKWNDSEYFNLDMLKAYDLNVCVIFKNMQYIAGNDSAEDEFFEIFNYLYDNKQQIIITLNDLIDVHKLQERNYVRLHWGLMCDR